MHRPRFFSCCIARLALAQQIFPSSPISTSPTPGLLRAGGVLSSSTSWSSTSHAVAASGSGSPGGKIAVQVEELIAPASSRTILRGPADEAEDDDPHRRSSPSGEQKQAQRKMAREMVSSSDITKKTTSTVVVSRPSGKNKRTTPTTSEDGTRKPQKTPTAVDGGQPKEDQPSSSSSTNLELLALTSCPVLGMRTAGNLQKETVLKFWKLVEGKENHRDATTSTSVNYQDQYEDEQDHNNSTSTRVVTLAKQIVNALGKRLGIFSSFTNSLFDPVAKMDQVDLRRSNSLWDKNTIKPAAPNATVDLDLLEKFKFSTSRHGGSKITTPPAEPHEGKREQAAPRAPPSEVLTTSKRSSSSTTARTKIRYTNFTSSAELLTTKNRFFGVARDRDRLLAGKNDHVRTQMLHNSPFFANRDGDLVRWFSRLHEKLRNGMFPDVVQDLIPVRNRTKNVLQLVMGDDHIEENKTRPPTTAQSTWRGKTKAEPTAVIGIGRPAPHVDVEDQTQQNREIFEILKRWFFFNSSAKNAAADITAAAPPASTSSGSLPEIAEKFPPRVVDNYTPSPSTDASTTRNVTSGLLGVQPASNRTASKQHLLEEQSLFANLQATTCYRILLAAIVVLSEYHSIYVRADVKNLWTVAEYSQFTTKGLALAGIFSSARKDVEQGNKDVESSSATSETIFVDPVLTPFSSLNRQDIAIHMNFHKIGNGGENMNTCAVAVAASTATASSSATSSSAGQKSVETTTTGEIRRTKTGYVMKAESDAYCNVARTSQQLIENCRERVRDLKAINPFLDHQAETDTAAATRGKNTNSAGAPEQDAVEIGGPSAFAAMKTNDTELHLHCPSILAREGTANISENQNSSSEHEEGGEEEEQLVLKNQDYHATFKYNDRMDRHKLFSTCQFGTEMWEFDQRSRHYCMINSLAHHLQLLPNESIFDFGSGCGHKMMWLQQLYGVRVYGVDIIKGAVDFANKYSADNVFVLPQSTEMKSPSSTSSFAASAKGTTIPHQKEDSDQAESRVQHHEHQQQHQQQKFCQVNYDQSLHLPFIKDNSFDYVLTCSVVQLLSIRAQCIWLKSVLRILKDTGKLVISCLPQGCDASWSVVEDEHDQTTVEAGSSSAEEGTSASSEQEPSTTTAPATNTASSTKTYTDSCGKRAGSWGTETMFTLGKEVFEKCLNSDVFEKQDNDVLVPAGEGADSKAEVDSDISKDVIKTSSTKAAATSFPGTTATTGGKKTNTSKHPAFSSVDGIPHYKEEAFIEEKFDEETVTGTYTRPYWWKEDFNVTYGAGSSTSSKANRHLKVEIISDAAMFSRTGALRGREPDWFVLREGNLNVVVTKVVGN
ncbi:unnamed protein product [Amoebophrya sp. A120]|nr:unnamed protein product [Amoebophrya sp. A120]|eukprot:GSA120T00022415001.1